VVVAHVEHGGPEVVALVLQVRVVAEHVVRDAGDVAVEHETHEARDDDGDQQAPHGDDDDAPRLAAYASQPTHAGAS
jgi:hypothetical protein